MKTALFATFVLSGLVCGPAFAAAADYKIVNRIKVTDGGSQYVTFDSASGRALGAGTDFTTVIGAKTGQASQLESGALGNLIRTASPLQAAVANRAGRYEVLVISP